MPIHILVIIIFAILVVMAYIKLIMADFNIGAKIKHKVLGEGDATAINGVGDSTKLTITFYDTKVIMASFV